MPELSGRRYNEDGVNPRAIETSFRTMVQVRVSPDLPYKITQARKARGAESNADYVRQVLCAALAADLGLDYEALYFIQPPTHSRNPGHLNRNGSTGRFAKRED